MPRPHRRAGVVALVVAVVAGGALLLRAPHRDAAAPPGRVTAAAAWPRAQRADLPANLADGPIFTPLYFLDAHTAVGSAPAPDGGNVRLLLRGPDAAVRLLRSRPLADGTDFGTVTRAGDTLLWTESTARRPAEVWAADLPGGPAHRLTADTGNAVFYGSQYDLVAADGRVYWTAAPGTGGRTEIRSVALTGGAVTVRTEPGTWALSAWPWLVEGGPDNAGSARLRSLTENRDVQVASSASELTTCGPVWCRAMVMSAAGLVRVDLLHPDGTGRRQIAGSGASEAVVDVAILDRFEILAEPEPQSDLTGTEKLLVYDLRTARTVDVSAAVSGAFARDGVLWWSTGDQDTLTYHTLDLRTV